jgi:septum formation protein
MDKNKKIILGSSSVFRKNLLERLNIEFDSISPNINEDRLKGESGKDMAPRLANLKAKKISNSNSNSIIICSDVCAVCDDKVLGKPGTKENAAKILSFISEKKIVFYNGTCIFDTVANKTYQKLFTYEILINKLNKKNIETYINKFNPIHSTAAFKYESGREFLVKKLTTDEPDLTGLIGLPLYYVKDIIELIKDNN